MSRRDAIERKARRNIRNKLPPFVPVLKDTLDAPAWKALSHGARSLFIALKRFYNSNDHNNGRLFLSYRDAAEQIGSHHKEIGRWFRELAHYGFIVQTSLGGLGVEGKGIAPHWRLTELGYMKDEPTRDYLKWDGTKFRDRKTKSRGGKVSQGVLEKYHSGVAEKYHSSAPKCDGKVAHSEGQNRGGKVARTNIPLPTTLGPAPVTLPALGPQTSSARTAKAQIPKSLSLKASPELLAKLKPVDPFAIDEDLSIPAFLDRRREVSR